MSNPLRISCAEKARDAGETAFFVWAVVRAGAACG